MADLIPFTALGGHVMWVARGWVEESRETRREIARDAKWDADHGIRTDDG